MIKKKKNEKEKTLDDKSSECTCLQPIAVAYR